MDFRLAITNSLSNTRNCLFGKKLWAINLLFWKNLKL